LEPSGVGGTQMRKVFAGSVGGKLDQR
jgi:hypothetical protein